MNFGLFPPGERADAKTTTLDLLGRKERSASAYPLTDRQTDRYTEMQGARERERQSEIDKRDSPGTIRMCESKLEIELRPGARVFFGSASSPYFRQFATQGRGQDRVKTGHDRQNPYDDWGVAPHNGTCSLHRWRCSGLRSSRRCPCHPRSGWKQHTRQTKREKERPRDRREMCGGGVRSQRREGV